MSITQEAGNPQPRFSNQGQKSKDDLSQGNRGVNQPDFRFLEIPYG